MLYTGATGPHDTMDNPLQIGSQTPPAPSISKLCPTCFKTYAKPHGLKVHILTVCGGAQHIWICSTCQHPSQSSDLAATHRRTVPACSKSPYIKTQLNYNRRQHACPHDERLFTQLNQFVYHIAYKCEGSVVPNQDEETSEIQRLQSNQIRALLRPWVSEALIQSCWGPGAVLEALRWQGSREHLVRIVDILQFGVDEVGDSPVNLGMRPSAVDGVLKYILRSATYDKDPSPNHDMVHSAMTQHDAVDSGRPLQTASHHGPTSSIIPYPSLGTPSMNNIQQYPRLQLHNDFQAIVERTSSVQTASHPAQTLPEVEDAFRKTGNIPYLDVYHGIGAGPSTQQDEWASDDELLS